MAYLCRALTWVILYIVVAASQIGQQVLADDNKTFVTHITTNKGKLKLRLHINLEDQTESGQRYVERVVAILNQYAPVLVEYFDYLPKGEVQFVVNRYSKQANGSATTFPREQIELYSFPPMHDQYLRGSESHLSILVLHELVHILHLDQTRGILKVLKTVFGSVGKMGGVVPAWFAEGLATWAETHFTQGGRLSLPLLRYEVLDFLLRSRCDGLDCLDEPGDYPYGSAAYWVGGAFLTSLEKEQPGTMRCLVRANSDSIMFFLNSTFIECTGMPAAQAFARFRNRVLEQYKVLPAPGEKLSSIDLPLFGDEFINWQKGVQLYDDQVVMMLNQNWMDKLYVQDLSRKDQGSRPRSKTSAMITALPKPATASFPVPVVTNLFLTTERKWRELDLKGLKLSESDLPFPRNTEYAFNLEQGRYLLLTYEDYRWKVQQWLDSGALKTIHELELLEELSQAQMHRKKDGTWVLGYQSTRGGEIEPYRYSLLTINDKAQVQTIMMQTQPLRFMDACGEVLLFKQKQGEVDQLLGYHKEAQTWLGFSDDSFTGWPANWQRDLAFLRANDKHLLLAFTSRPGKVYELEGGCESLLARTNPAAIAQPMILARPERPMPAMDKRSYFPLAYMTPQYWMFNYQSGDSEPAIGALTSLNDPMGYHSVSLAGNYFMSLEKWGGQGTYLYNFSPQKISSFRMGASYYKNFERNIVSDRAHVQETNSVYGMHTFQWERVLYTPMLNYAFGHQRDLLGARELKWYQAFQTLYYEKLFFDDIWQWTQFMSRHFKQESSQANAFFGEEYRLQNNFRWSETVYSNLNASYGKLHKRELQGGTIYAGGGNDFLHSNYHEFYGLNSNDAFGNEVITGRWQFEVRVSETYSGGPTFPLYFKRIKLLGGMDYLKTDIIYLGKRTLLRYDDIYSYHGGMRFDINIAFRLPLVADLIYAYVPNPRGDDVLMGMLFLRGTFWP